MDPAAPKPEAPAAPPPKPPIHPQVAAAVLDGAGGAIGALSLVRVAVAKDELATVRAQLRVAAGHIAKALEALPES